MTEHGWEKAMAVTSGWRARVRAENDGAGTRIEQRSETLGEFQLPLLAEKVEERGSVNDGDMPT